MPLFYHGSAAWVKMDYCCFCHSTRCIFLHGEKVQKRCYNPSLSLSRPLVVVCSLFFCPSLLLSLVFAGGGMASAGRGEIPPKSVHPLCVWFLFDSFIASNASMDILTACRVRCPLTPDGLCRNPPQVGSPNFTPCGKVQIAPFCNGCLYLSTGSPPAGEVWLEAPSGSKCGDFTSKKPKNGGFCSFLQVLQ